MKSADEQSRRKGGAIGDRQNLRGNLGENFLIIFFCLKINNNNEKKRTNHEGLLKKNMKYK